MRVLVACEFSGTVREAFRRRGHDAWSCDLLPAEDGSPYHIEDDAVLVACGHSGALRDGISPFDLMIAHPPCTYLASSGLHWNGRVQGRAEKTEAALRFVLHLMAVPVPRIAIENPIGCISTRIRKPDQVVQPWHFGDDASKATCLWLKGLPLLRPTKMLESPAWIRCESCDDFYCTLHREHVYDCKCPSIDTWAKRGIDPYTQGGRRANQTPSGQNKLGPSPDRWKLRSITYPGFAEAMAEQWGALEQEKAA